MMLPFLFSRAGAMTAGVVFAMILAVWAINTAYQAGRDVERTASLTNSVEILRKRSAIDDQIRSMDSGSLCAALGGRFVPDDGTCQ